MWNEFQVNLINLYENRKEVTIIDRPLPIIRLEKNIKGEVKTLFEFYTTMYELKYSILFEKDKAEIEAFNKDKTIITYSDFDDYNETEYVLMNGRFDYDELNDLVVDLLFSLLEKT